MSAAEWVLPEEALPRAHEGSLVLPPPQVYEMTRIAQVRVLHESALICNYLQTPFEKLKDYENKTLICPQHVSKHFL